MNEAEVRERVLTVLARVAPEVDLAALDPDESLRVQADLDSVDIMNVVVGLHEALGVDVPQSDYGELETLDGAVAYIAQRLRVATDE